MSLRQTDLTRLALTREWTAQALLGRTPGPPALQSRMSTQLTCATLRGLYPGSLFSSISLHLWLRCTTVPDAQRMHYTTYMHLCTVTSHKNLSSCVKSAAGAEQLAGLWMWACAKPT